MAKLFEIYAELGLDASKFDKGVKAASKQGNTLASNVTSGLQTVSAKTIAMGHAMYDFAKTAAMKAGNFVKDVIGSYADYEQLVGGVNKMFGDSAGDVISNAQRAYSTAGMSMNDYMQTVTSFSASLISSLKGDTVAAAKIADMALQDMSDNANTFGTDMASIQNAYQGFAKQNYTMLDNLKLGYGGTKTEMQRLLKDAQKIQRAQGNNVRYSINNLDDVYEAIHVIQQEMKITGTTAAEASQTISGSYHATMAAWSNIMTGLGTDQEMDKLIGGFVESGSNLVKNVVQLVPKIGKNVFEKAGPVIAGYMSELGKKALETGSNLLANVLNGLTGDTTSGAEISAYISGVWTDAKAGAESLISTGSGLLKGIYDGLVGDSDSKTGIVAEISGIWNEASTSVQSLIDSAGGLLGTIYTQITGQEATAENIGKTIGGVFNAGGTAINNVLDTASTFFSDLGEKLGDPDASIGEKIAGVFNAGSTAMESLLGSAGTFLSHLYTAITGDTTNAQEIKDYFSNLGTDAAAAFNAVQTTSVDFLSNFYSALTADEGGNRQNIITYFEELWADVAKTATSVKSAAADLLAELYEFLSGQEATAENVGSTAGSLVKGVGTFVSDVVNSASNVTGSFANLTDSIREGDADKRKEAEVQILAGLSEAATAFMQLPVDVIDAFRGEGATEAWMAEASGLNDAMEEKSAQLGKTVEELDQMGLTGSSGDVLSLFGSMMGIATSPNIGFSQRGYVQDPGILESWQKAQEQNAVVIKSQADLINMIGNMWGDASMLGLTESQLDDWMSIISAGKKDDEYYSVAKAVMEAFKQYDDDKNDETPAVPSITVNVTLNGEEIGASIEEQVTDGVTGRVMRQFRQADLVTA